MKSHMVLSWKQKACDETKENIQNDFNSIASYRPNALYLAYRACYRAAIVCVPAALIVFRLHISTAIHFFNHVWYV